MKKLLFMLLQFMVGCLFGLAIADAMFTMIDQNLVVGLIVVVFSLIIGFYGQLILHEGGHLLFGLLSGYKFLSFRIGSFMIQENNGKLEFRRMKLQGTAGQCLLCPPEIVNGTFPTILYNLGGVIINVVTSLIGFVIAYFTTGGIHTFFIIFSAFGMIFAITNGIPMNTGDVTNDGYNALNLGKDMNASMAFWKQLKINELQTRGVRLKDMDASFFEQEGDKQNVLISTILVMKENYYMDRHDFEQAKELIDYLLCDKCKIIGIHKELLKNDLAYISCLNKEEYVMDKNLNKFRKAMKSFPSIIRTTYALSLYRNENVKKVLGQFDKISKTYPIQSDIDMERELMEVVKNVYM